MKKCLLLLTLAFSFYSYSQTIPEDDIIPICDGQSISTGAPGNSGIHNIVTSCSSQPLSPFLDFYYIRIQSGTTFTFLVEPVGNDDYDFAAWLNPNWNNLNSTPNGNKRGSQNDPNQTGIYHLGLSLTATDLCEEGGSTGYPEPGLLRYFDVQPGDEILIAIDRWSQTSQGYTISFGGNAELDCTILGNSYGKCDTDGNGQESFVQADFLSDLNADFPGGQFEFYTTQTNAEQSTGPQVTFPYTINMSDNPSELFVRVENANGAFIRVVQIFLYINELPQLTSPVDLPALCDAGGDGEEAFDLTQAENDLVADPGLYTFKYYESQADADAGGPNIINTPATYSSGSTTVYVRVETGSLDGNEEGCFSVGEINLILTEQTETEFDLVDEYCLGTTPAILPNLSDNGITGTWAPATINTTTLGTTVYTFTPALSECATEFQIEIEVVEGITPAFTLDEVFCEGITAPLLPTVSDNEIAGTWFPAIIDTSTPGTAIYTFTPDDSNCTTTYELEIEIVATAQLNTNVQIELCDENFDGTYEYNLSDLNGELITSDTGLIFSYYATQQDFDNGTSIPQNQWANYQFNDLPVSIIVSALTEEGCMSQPVQVQFIEGQDITLLTGPYEIPFCEGTPVDLTDFHSIYSSEAGVTFTYYLSLDNAESETSPLTDTNNYLPSGIGSVIYVRLEKADRCPSIVEVEFTAGQEVMHNPGPFGPIRFCEDETIDLTVFESEIAQETGVSFGYYETLSNAENEINPITDEADYLAQGNGVVYVRLEKTDRCDVIVELEFAQRPSPEIQGLGPLNRIICEGRETIEIEAVSNDPGATFLWTWGNNQSHDSATIEISQAGTYVLTVTDTNGCTSTEQLVIAASPSPVIKSIESGNNYLVVSAEPGGSGLLEYSLNNVIWQTSPRFDNLLKGEIYTVYVRENGCMVSSYQAVILDVPNFISPNGDGYNDQWTIRGIEITPQSTIKIFDRYGKIFVDTSFDGNYVWDGKYGGRPLPSGDYWYIMEVPSDGIIIAQKFVGHVSIKNL